MIVTSNPAVAKGDMVRIVKVDHENVAWMEGAEIEADRNYEEHFSFFYIPGYGSISCKFEIVKVEDPANRYTAPMSYEVLREEKERIEKQVAHWRERCESLEKITNTLWADFQKINDALGEEASDRGWCAEYESFVKGLNSSMTHFTFDLPTIEFEVTVQRVRTVYEQVTVIVEASRGATERDLADSAFEEAGNSYDWDMSGDDVSDDYEVVDMREA